MLRWLHRLMNKTLNIPCVYLSGTFENHCGISCMNWRSRARRILDVGVCDPLEYEINIGKGGLSTSIVRVDVGFISRSTILLVNAEKPSWGTAMEVAKAYAMGKLIFAFGAGEKPSPWLVFHCDRIFDDLEHACRAINMSEWKKPV